MSKRKPLLRLTKKQREAIKGALDAMTIGCALALTAKRQEDDEYEQRFNAGIQRYDEIVQVLSVLGVVIEGYELMSGSDPSPMGDLNSTNYS